MEPVPSPADAPRFTAEELLERLHNEGARVYRMREAGVFCLTDRAETADWLLDLGGRPYRQTPFGFGDAPAGSYLRARGGKTEWDIFIHTIPLKGEHALWELL